MSETQYDNVLLTGEKLVELAGKVDEIQGGVENESSKVSEIENAIDQFKEFIAGNN